MVGRPSLEHVVEITDASGTRYRWDSSGRPEYRPQAISFGTKTGDGFAQASMTLARRVDVDYTDLALYNDVVITLADGTVVYEGRISSTPRSVGPDGHSISISCVGWMAHAKDRKFSEVYVDRDLAKWQSMGFNRRVSYGYTVPVDQDYRFSADNGGLRFEGVDAKAITSGSATEAWYAAPEGVTISELQYNGAESNTTNAEAARAYTGTDDALSGAASVALTLDSTLRSATLTAQQFVMLRGRATATHTPAAGSPFNRRYSALGLYGNHTLTRRSIDGGGPNGVCASEVITNIAQRFCPKLNTSGVQATTYAIPHLVFERQFPFDAFLETNKYHLWDLGVWENKTLTFRPFDLTDYDWEIRLDDFGVSVDFQGDSTENLANGIVVTYQDVDTGRTEVITPDGNSALADTTVTNPANMWGLKVWTEATISIPTTATSAADIGRALLAEFNAPKSPGAYRVTGHIKDRAGHWQSVSKVRAGDTIAITSSNSLSDRPHLIVETSYTDDDKTVQIGVDNTLPRVDAVMDRINTVLVAANLT